MNELCRLRRSEEYGVNSDEASDFVAQCLPALWHGTQLGSGLIACTNGLRWGFQRVLPLGFFGRGS